MRYLGGKFKIRKQVAEIIDLLRKPGQLYVEPFVGSGCILQSVKNPRLASDFNPWLITMYKALMEGWDPPSVITEDDRFLYKMLKPLDDPLTAFIGFGCSFGGKWFSGYARGESRNYADETARGLLKQKLLFEGAKFKHCSYDDHDHTGAFIYCDPPYAGTAGYSAVGAFDHSKFWQWVREQSSKNTVIVSEYSAPDDFLCIAEFHSRMGLRSTKGEQELRSEKIFMYNGVTCL